MATTTNSGKPGSGGPPKVYALIGVLLAVLLVGAGGMLWFGGQQAAMPTVGGPFTLENGDGAPVSDKNFRGRFMLVYFGYTFCPDVCPTTLTAVADAMDKLGSKADRVQPLFVTVDPKRDTPSVVKQYAAAFGPRVIGLTGTPDQVAAAAKAYRVYYAEHRTGPGPNDYTMDHSSILYLMGPDGSFIAPIRADQSGDEMAAAISRLIS
jgi:protein SCO1/2